MEEVDPPLIKNPEDKFCEDHFKITFYKDESGKYVVSLPFKENIPEIGTNTQNVQKWYLSQERRLDKNLEAKDQCYSFLAEYKSLGHMEPTTSSSSYLLPHHSVFKSNSCFSKIRIAFNASSKDDLNLSLNDRLHIGPKLETVAV